MPALPWTTVSPSEPSAECTVMASRLPLASYLGIPRFVYRTLLIRRQLNHTPGLIGYTLDAELWRKTFWTVSAWTGRAEIGRFDRTDPHADTKNVIRPMMRQSTFVMWSATVAELPISWSEVRRRIETERATGGHH